MAKSSIILPRLLPRDSSAETTTTTTTSTTERPALYDYGDGKDGDIRFNERMELLTAEGMRIQMRKALQRGLPVPILTVFNYLSHQEEGFRWSFDFRLAGHYCEFVLTLTLICWAWMNIFFLVIPRYGAIAMIATGILALISVFLYWILLPAREMVIHLNGAALHFKLGGCYWTVLTSGWAALITGVVLLVVDLHRPGAITFDFELVESEAKQEKVNKLVEKRSVKLQPSVKPTEMRKVFNSLLILKTEIIKFC